MALRAFLQTLYLYTFSYRFSWSSMAASFYASPLIGATTTLACFAHEIPHEIADYSILIRSGFTKGQAMRSQFLTAVGAFVCYFFLSHPGTIIDTSFVLQVGCGHI